MSAVLVAEELGRWYGQVVGLNDLSVAMQGGITGLIGPNGAGKSTFLKLIAGELKPSRGSIRVLGEAPFANRSLYRRLGFCPQQDALYDDMSGLRIVQLLLRLTGFGAREARERAQRALARVGMEQDMKRRVGGYSKGMRQRVKIAQTIAHEPELLVLDEPLTGLDPIGRRDMILLLRELGDAGTHVLISSHVLHEVEDLTQDIILLHRGRLLAQGALGDIRRLLRKHPRRVRLRAARPRELATALMGLADVRAVQLGEGDDLVSVETRDVDAFFRELTPLAQERRFGLAQLESVDAGLEAVFDYLVLG